MYLHLLVQLLLRGSNSEENFLIAPQDLKAQGKEYFSVMVFLHGSIFSRRIPVHLKKDFEGPLFVKVFSQRFRRIGPIFLSFKNNFSFSQKLNYYF